MAIFSAPMNQTLANYINQAKTTVNSAVQPPQTTTAPTTTTTQATAPTSSQQTGMLAGPTVNLAQPAPEVTPTPAQVTNATAAYAASPGMLQQNQDMGTVEGRTARIIDSNSPLMQRAAAKAMERMNARGLRNSSVAIGAGQNAVIEAAAPMAARDAASYNEFQKQNQAVQADMSKYNAGMLQQTNLANASAANQLESQNSQQALQAALQNQANTQQVNLANMQQQNKLVFDQLDQANKVELANIQAAYKNEMQANVTAQNLFQSAMGALAKIQENKNMNAATKQRNMDQIIQMLKAGLNMSGSIANLNLGATLDFSGLTSGMTTQGSATTTGTTTGTTPWANQRHPAWIRKWYAGHGLSAAPIGL